MYQKAGIETELGGAPQFRGKQGHRYGNDKMLSCSSIRLNRWLFVKFAVVGLVESVQLASIQLVTVNIWCCGGVDGNHFDTVTATHFFFCFFAVAAVDAAVIPVEPSSFAT